MLLGEKPIQVADKIIIEAEETEDYRYMLLIQLLIENDVLKEGLQTLAAVINKLKKNKENMKDMPMFR